MSMRHVLSSFSSRRKNGALTARILVIGATMLLGAGIAPAETLRLSTLKMPGSDSVKALEEFKAKVAADTNGRVEIKIYPASQLGDWTEVYEQVIQGSVDMALQSLSSADDRRLAITWFPYVFTDYKSAETSLSPGGTAFEIVNGIVADKGITLLAVYGTGLGGAGFSKPVNAPEDPDAKHNLKVRVWQGGTTHRVMLERLGYNVATLAYSELYTGMQTGVVDGQIGGTAQMALDAFKDVTKTWIQYNDHYEHDWLFINSGKLASLSPEDQKVIRKYAAEMAAKRFAETKAAEDAALAEMRKLGITVVTFDPATLDTIVKVVRREVWPKIVGEVGDDIMARLKQSLNIE
ncbi:TRAP transporter substrate-binding protein DctP [Chelatococcus sp. GCM10030263]|uniref:TRAP transporter substrate-binding protein DctP n=1 Tax=Chelatococcus sp. GCM10030263 TaxID=3273387 RepID=UPI00361AB523